MTKGDVGTQVVSVDSTRRIAAGCSVIQSSISSEKGGEWSENAWMLLLVTCLVMLAEFFCFILVIAVGEEASRVEGISNNRNF